MRPALKKRTWRMRDRSLRRPVFVHCAPLEPA
jgi:hypothetical protein